MRSASRLRLSRSGTFLRNSFSCKHKEIQLGGTGAYDPIIAHRIKFSNMSKNILTVVF